MNLCCCPQNLFIALQPPPHDGGSALAGFSIMLRCNAGAAAAAAVCPSSEPRPFMSPEWVEVFRGEYKGSAVPVLNLLPGTRYEFRAAACNAFGCSVYSEVGSAVTLPAEPLPPATPQLQSAAGHSLTVRWQEPYGHGSAVTKYKLSYACLGPVGGNSSAPPPAAAPASSLPEPGQRATDNGGEVVVWTAVKRCMLQQIRLNACAVDPRQQLHVVSPVLHVAVGRSCRRCVTHRQ